jgi:hypothetical protein
MAIIELVEELVVTAPAKAVKSAARKQAKADAVAALAGDEEVASSAADTGAAAASTLSAEDEPVADAPLASADSADDVEPEDSKS